MEIQATIQQKVNINPAEVIEKLIEESIKERAVYERSGKYYEGISGEVEEEILKEKYDYVKALQLVLQYLTK